MANSNENKSASAAPVYQIPAPDPFTFKDGESWTKWLSRFERFRNASGLFEKPENDQVNSLIYLMGQQAEDILLSFNLTENELGSYETVKERFQNYFIPTRNIVYERYKFYTRTQEEGETVESFVTSLHTLAKNCDFPATFHDEMIRDKIVCGIRDKKISERLQLEKELTLEKAVTTARQAETVRKQQEAFKNSSSTYVTNRVAVPKNSSDKKNVGDKRGISKHTPTSYQTGETCFWCGKSRKHTKQECPARKAVCNKCKKVGHYSKVCKSKIYIHELSEERSLSKGFLGRIQKPSVQSEIVDSSENKWFADVYIKNTKVKFKIDTGADVTVIPFKLYKSKLKYIKIKETNKKICGPEGGKLQVAGVFRVTLKSSKGKYFQETVYVVHKLEHSLLSCVASEGLNLIRRINELNSAIDPLKEFPKLFQGIGNVKKPCRIQLKSNAKPYAVSVPRKVPLPLKDELKIELDEMVRNNVIEPVDEPTEWCAPMVLVPKKNEKIRICVDLTVLNNNIEREYFPMASVDYTLSQFENAKFFSIIDANSGFWQISLEPESANLTTFITPFGRYRFKRLPFGIKTAPEIFQKRIRETIPESPGVVGLMDEFVIFGKTEDEHDQRLRDVLSKLQADGWTLNFDKCQFKKSSINFLGHIISEGGIKPDPKKTEAIANIPQPKDITEVKRFLGMANFLNKFIPGMSEKAQPLYELLKKDVMWTWGDQQEKAFQAIKNSLCTAPELAMYDCRRETMISADASSYGLGAVLLQKQKDNSIRPVCYASRTLSDSEKQYAQIEKEALAIVWACSRFHDYIMGLTVQIETDHKPLVPILMAKPLDNLTPRLQRMKLRMMRYDYTVSYTPGKDLIPADTLSRSPLPEKGEEELKEEMDAYVQMVFQAFPASDKRLTEIWLSQKEDEICQQLYKFTEYGWPDKNEIPNICQKYWEHRHSIVVQDGLLLKDSRIIIPKALQRDILNHIHEGHQGITKCRARAREAVWWPGLSVEIENLVSNCSNCIEHQKYNKEPLIPSEFPERPWQSIGADLLKLKGHWYLILSDYYSRYFEIAKLENMTSVTVINHMKSIFARHGIPEIVRSDNGSQFTQVMDSQYKKFSDKYGFAIVTSSPRYAQSNGFIESMVKNFKKHYLKSDSEDPYLMLLAVRATPLENGYSPAELLMGRKLRTPLPITRRQLTPNIPDPEKIRVKENRRIDRQKFYFDRHHHVRNLPDLHTGQEVWISDMRTYGTVKSRHEAPRSYLVETPRGILRRNRSFLHPSQNGKFSTEEMVDLIPNIPDDEAEVDVPEKETDEQNFKTVIEIEKCKEKQTVPEYKTRSGRMVHPPKRLDL